MLLLEVSCYGKINKLNVTYYNQLLQFTAKKTFARYGNYGKKLLEFGTFGHFLFTQYHQIFIDVSVSITFSKLHLIRYSGFRKNDSDFHKW